MHDQRIRERTHKTQFFELEGFGQQCVSKTCFWQAQEPHSGAQSRSLDFLCMQSFVQSVCSKAVCLCPQESMRSRRSAQFEEIFNASFKILRNEQKYGENKGPFFLVTSDADKVQGRVSCNPIISISYTCIYIYVYTYNYIYIYVDYYIKKGLWSLHLCFLL